MREVTFKDFATLARSRGHTAESLAERFRGKIEEPWEFFERVMLDIYGRQHCRTDQICQREGLE
jgi:hypothetical protein